MSSQARIVDVTQPAELRLPQGTFAATSFVVEEGGLESAHLALAVGRPRDGSLVRIASACITGEVFGCRRCDCAEQLQRALATVSANGEGLLTYHPSDEGYGLGLHMKIARLADLDASPGESVHRPQKDTRTFSAAALIVAHFGLRSVRLLSANERKLAALRDRGVEAEFASPP